MSESSTDLGDYTDAELQEQHEFYQRRGWNTSADRVAAELESRGERPGDTEEELSEADQWGLGSDAESDTDDDTEPSVATLQERVRVFESRGWEDQAEQARAELEQATSEDPDTEAEELGRSDWEAEELVSPSSSVTVE